MRPPQRSRSLGFLIKENLRACIKTIAARARTASMDMMLGRNRVIFTSAHLEHSGVEDERWLRTLTDLSQARDSGGKYHYIGVDANAMLGKQEESGVVGNFAVSPWSCRRGRWLADWLRAKQMIACSTHIRRLDFINAPGENEK